MINTEIAEKPGMATGEVCVPLKALAQPDDADQMQEPTEGDSGTMQVDYTVTRIEGENAYIKPTAVNGTSLEAEAELEPESPDIAEGNSLRAEAEERTY